MSEYKEDVSNCDNAAYPFSHMTDQETEYKKDVIDCDDEVLIKDLYDDWRRRIELDGIGYDLETTFPNILLPHGRKVPASEVRLLCGNPKSLSTKICTDEAKDLPYKKVCRDIADYKEDVIKCDHATDSKVPRNISNQCLEEKKSKGSCLDVKTRAPIVSPPHQEDISAIKTNEMVYIVPS